MPGAYKRPHQRKPGGRYTASWIDQHGRRRSKAGFADKAKTLELARRLETEAQLVREGLIEAKDQSARKANARPIVEHADDYRLFLISKGDTEKHAGHVRGALVRLSTEAGASRLSELRPERLQAALASLRVKRSARTANHALGALKSFLRWSKATGRLAEVPGWLDMLKPANERVNRKRVRRVLTPDEVTRLMRAAYAGPDIQTRRKPAPAVMTGEDRAWLYHLAVETGLRASELASLTPESFDLDADSVKVAAAYSKHRRDDVLPLRPHTASRTATWLKGRPPGQPVFAMPEKAGKMLARDLAAAHVPVTTKEGVIDFHSLRHTFISGLIERGTDPKTAQELSRHSTITLTVDRYSHTTEARKRAAIEAMNTGQPGEGETA